jgi:hypothetical protein
MPLMAALVASVDGGADDDTDVAVADGDDAEERGDACGEPECVGERSAPSSAPREYVPPTLRTPIMTSLSRRMRRGVRGSGAGEPGGSSWRRCTSAAK